MAIRYVSFQVSEDTTVTPLTPQYGGVQGEHNATEVAFSIEVNGTLANPNYTYYIECVDAAGGYDRTDTLYRHGSTISTLVPLAWTQYGGISTLRLVIEEDGVTIYSVEGRLQFEDRGAAAEQVDGLLRTDLSDTLAACHEAADRCAAAADRCDEAAADMGTLGDELRADTDARCAAMESEITALGETLRAEMAALPPISTDIAEDKVWSSRHTADTLCPLINESGRSVSCYPLMGYPLQVSVQRPNYLYFDYAPDYGDYVESGITFTRREDNSIVANGTATSDAIYFIFNGYETGAQNPLVTGEVNVGTTLTLQGCPAGGGKERYGMWFYTGNSGGVCYDYGDTATISVTAKALAATYGWECAIIIKKGFTADNLVFRPRLQPMGYITFEQSIQGGLNISELWEPADFTVMPTMEEMRFAVSDNATLTVRGYGSIATTLDKLSTTVEETVDTALGTVDEALSNIIAIQEQLMGGGYV